MFAARARLDVSGVGHAERWQRPVVLRKLIRSDLTGATKRPAHFALVWAYIF